MAPAKVSTPISMTHADICVGDKIEIRCMSTQGTSPWLENTVNGIEVVDVPDELQEGAGTGDSLATASEPAEAGAADGDGVSGASRAQGAAAALRPRQRRHGVAARHGGGAKRKRGETQPPPCPRQSS